LRSNGSFGPVFSAKQPDALPASANSFNDEFDGSSLDAKWTVRNNPSGNTVTVANGQLTYSNTDNNNAYCIDQASGSTFKITAKFSIMPSSFVSYPGAGMFLYDTVSSKGTQFMYIAAYGGAKGSANQPPKITIDHLNNFDESGGSGSNPNVFLLTVGNSTTSFNFPLMHPLYFQIEQDSSTLHYRWSFDGQNFLQLFSESKSTFMTSSANRCGLIASTFGATFEAHFDWIRKT